MTIMLIAIFWTFVGPQSCPCSVWYTFVQDGHSQAGHFMLLNFLRNLFHLKHKTFSSGSMMVILPCLHACTNHLSQKPAACRSCYTRHILSCVVLQFPQCSFKCMSKIQHICSAPWREACHPQKISKTCGCKLPLIADWSFILSLTLGLRCLQRLMSKEPIWWVPWLLLLGK